MKYTIETIQQALSLKKQGMRSRAIASALGVSKSIVNYWCAEATAGAREAAELKPVADGYDNPTHSEPKEVKSDYFILTSAQNNTFIHNTFWQALMVAKEYFNAELLVSGFTYNRNGFSNKSKDDSDLWYDPKIRQYMCNERLKLAKNLEFCGELNITPTATNPLTGLHNYLGENNGIVPHVKIALESLASHRPNPARMLYTTGACTKMNYRQQRTGQLAEWHHSYGAILVEVCEDGHAFVYQLNADTATGEFYWLNKLFTPKGVVENTEVLAINFPDLHSEKLEDEFTEMVFGCVKRNDKYEYVNAGNMVDVLKPKYVFLHDVVDWTARNHHSINDPYFRFKQHWSGKDNVEVSLRGVAETIEAITRDFSKTVVVYSNHDTALTTWLKTACYKTDPENSLFFLESQLAMYRAMREGIYHHPFQHYVEKVLGETDKVLFLKEDESFRLADIEFGAHGHLGANGSRGTSKGFAKLGVRANTGHSHSACIYQGVYTAGVATFKPYEYARGASSWSCSFIITYPNGKRCIVTAQPKRWRK